MPQDIEMSQGEAVEAANLATNDLDTPFGQSMDAVLARAVDKAVDKAIKDAVDNAVKKAFNDLLDRVQAFKFSDTPSVRIDGQATSQSAGNENTHAHSHLRTGFSYEIHVCGYDADTVLLVDKNYSLVYDLDFAKRRINKKNYKFHQWKCIEVDGWLCFQNVGIGTFLGVSEKVRPYGEHLLDARSGKINENTKFCLGRANRDKSDEFLLSYLLDYRHCPVEISIRESPGNDDYTEVRLITSDSEPGRGTSLRFKAVE